MNCKHPNCRTDASDTYSDEHGNTLRLCEKHYYQNVTGGSVISSSVTVDATSPLGARSANILTSDDERFVGGSTNSRGQSNFQNLDQATE